MGLYSASRRSAGQYQYRSAPEKIRVPKGNPNPVNFKVVKVEQVGDNAVAIINYPDCDNYEGNKVLVFENTSYVDLLTAKFIDPHFTDEDTLKPVARFEPTPRGWSMAVRTARFLGK